VFAFDINSACAGFVHGLALANGLILGGQARSVLLVNADTYSKFIHPKDRSTRVLFGDGAAATWLTRHETRGIRDIVCATWGKLHDKFIIPAGGCRLPRSPATAAPIERDKGAVTTQDHINMDGMGILQFVAGKVPQQVREILDRNQLKADDIDLFVFHQASRVALDTLTRTLRLDPKKVFSNLPRIGNIVSASIPVAMRDAMGEGVIKPGSKVLVCGFGVGLTWASAIIDF
jgi:3-oxoacyl-[acyl-carrier-protein] synthase-3